MNDLDAFLATAWNEHADDAAAVAERLATSFHLLRDARDVAAYARLLCHVHGEHLGRWRQGAALLDAMRSLPPSEEPGTTRLLIALAASLRFGAGDDDALDTLDSAERALALATAATAFAGRGDPGRAIATYDEALALGEAGLPEGAAAIRALAVTGNNLAAALETKPDRSASETMAMVAAAHAGLVWWRRAGTWLEEERAEHRLARSLIAAGAPEDATAHAMRCVALCDDHHGAVPFERFFAQAALALSHRAAGRQALCEIHRAIAVDLAMQLSAQDRVWCEDDLVALGA